MKEVRIDIVEDETRYFGHALISFYDTSVPSGPLRLFVSRKSTDTPHLGADGWQASPVALDVELLSQTAGKTVVRAGPTICDKVPYSLYVRLQVDGADAFGHAFWPEVMQSPKGYSAVLGDSRSEPEISRPLEALEPAPSPEPPVVFEPPPVVKSAPAEELSSKTEKPARKPVWIYLVLFLLAGGGAGLAYWQWDKIIPAETPQTEIPTATPQTPAETLSAKLERLKQSDDDGDELLALSDEAFEAADRGIAQQAIELAINRGNEAAKLQQAQWYDPRSFAANRVEAIDANRAARSYFELALGGNTQAIDLLKSICADSKIGGANYRDFFETTYCQGSLNP